MLPITESFRFDYRGSDIVYGRGCIDQLGTYLEANDCTTAMIVCGSNVGANEALMGPIRESLGNRLAGVFDETSTAKAIETVYDGIDRLEELEADVIVGVGGGSSLDIARFISVMADDGRSLATLRETARDGDFEQADPSDSCVPVVVIPTTFAGADISRGGSSEIIPAAESPTGLPVRLSGSIMPIGMFYDPELFETTPQRVLDGSAMNGFNKGLETLYVDEPNPFSDSTAIHGLGLMREALPKVSADDSAAMDQAVIGTILLQFERQTAIIHAFGHGFSRRYPVQQGVVHAIVAPHVLRYTFEQVDARRKLLARGLGVDDDTHTSKTQAAAIVKTVLEIRDSLSVPTRLREIDGLEKAALPDIADAILADGAMTRNPAGLDPSHDDIMTIFEAAW